MDKHPIAIDGLATALKWATRFLVALYAAAIVAPLVIFGLTANSVILSSIAAMGVPAAVTCLYIVGATVVRALWPAAVAILRLSELIWQIGCSFFRRRHP